MPELNGSVVLVTGANGGLGTVIDGLDNTLDAFLGLMRGHNLGRSTIHRIIHGDPATDSHPSGTTGSREAGASETQPHAL